MTTSTIQATRSSEPRSIRARAVRHCPSEPMYYSKLMEAIDTLTRATNALDERLTSTPPLGSARMMTTTEAAAVLNLCRNSLEAMVEKGTLREGYHYYQHGNKRCFHPALIDRLLDGPGTEPTAPKKSVKNHLQNRRAEMTKISRRTGSKTTINADY